MSTRDRSQDATTAIPCIYITRTTDQCHGGNAWHEFDTEVMKTSHFSYNANFTKIRLDKGEGYYEIIFECSYELYTTEHRLITLKDTIYLNGSAIPDASSWTGFGEYYNADGQLYEDFLGNNKIHIIQYLKPGDEIKVYMDTKWNYAACAVADTCRLIIRFLPMHGWNNSSGGQLEYKGGVMR